MKLSRKAGATSQIFQIFIQDSTATFLGLTGLTNASAGLTAYYHRDTDTTATAISLVSMTVGTYTSSGFKEIDSVNMPGWYQFCLPNAALAVGAESVGLHLQGATNMVPLPIEVDLHSQVDLTAIDGQLTAGNNATLNLKKLNIVNNAGDALVAQSTGSNGNGINATGNGTGVGIVGTGGLTGDGASFVGGATSGNGIDVSATLGHGMRLIGAGANKHDLTLAGTGDVSGDLKGNVIGAGSGGGPSGLVFGGVGVEADVESIGGSPSLDTYTAKVWPIDDTTHTVDRYIVVWFKNGQPVTVGITVPKIQVIKESDGTDLIALTNMNQIATTGLYSYEEPVNRLVLGAGYIVKVTATINAATRTWYQPFGLNH